MYMSVWRERREGRNSIIILQYHKIKEIFLKKKRVITRHKTNKQNQNNLISQLVAMIVSTLLPPLGALLLDPKSKSTILSRICYLSGCFTIAMDGNNYTIPFPRGPRPGSKVMVSMLAAVL